VYGVGEDTESDGGKAATAVVGAGENNTSYRKDVLKQKKKVATEQRKTLSIPRDAEGCLWANQKRVVVETAQLR